MDVNKWINEVFLSHLQVQTQAAEEVLRKNAEKLSNLEKQNDESQKKLMEVVERKVRHEVTNIGTNSEMNVANKRFNKYEDTNKMLKTELEKLESRMSELTTEVARLKSTADMLHSFEKAHDITQAISMQLNKLLLSEKASENDKKLQEQQELMAKVKSGEEALQQLQQTVKEVNTELHNLSSFGGYLSRCDRNITLGTLHVSVKRLRTEFIHLRVSTLDLENRISRKKTNAFILTD
ncbi:hypothetical protein WR25_24616 isoform A [Diploscapter pachys]|uniref:Uncharacterized protein n=3 Tax=Diploscapter pachys TaxID=2018661 RepID=A0A2A2J8U1_9BILA|nr:hypothetical protein WR25_24616 isoform A [Diploscapter pachys]